MPSGYRELCKHGVSVREAWHTSKSVHRPWGFFLSRLGGSDLSF